MATLKNWSITGGVYDPYLVPELRNVYLQGEVYDHPNPRHHDGKEL